MKRYFFIIFLFLATKSSAQIFNFGKTLPVRAYSIGAAGTYNVDNQNSDGGFSYFVFGGYGINYSTDINFKYGYFTGADYFGADIQVLFKEKRKSYFTGIGGLHWQKGLWLDITGGYTYTPQYFINLTVGLDLELGLKADPILRAWIPLNFGIHASEYIYLFFEYELPANGNTWDIISLGANFIIR